MTTARDIITGAAKLIKVLRKGEALAADNAADGLVSLNDMISSWGNNSLLVTSRAWESFNVGAASSYSIGTGQTLNTTRPTEIKAAFIRSGGIDYPLEIATDEQYESIIYKSLTSPYPQYLSIDNAYPYGTIRLYPALGAASELHILSEKPLTEFASLNATVDLAPGWKRALRFNLAVEMAPEYEVEIPLNVIAIAQQSLSSIALAIAKNRPIKSNPIVVPRNIFTGYYA